MLEERKEGPQRYRDAAEAYLGGPTVEAAGIFWRNVRGWTGSGIPDEFDPDFPMVRATFRWLRGMVSPSARLYGFFLLAVTRDKVHALDYGGHEELVVTREIAAFDRDEVRLRRDAAGKAIYLENKRHRVELGCSALEENRGAAQVMAALSGSQADTLSE
jgi:hypothetical protein